MTRRRTASTIRFAAFNLGHYEQVQVERSGYVVDVCANRALETALQPRMQQTMSLSATAAARQSQGSIVVGPAHASMAPSPVAELQRVATEVASSVEFMVSKFGPPALPHITVSPVSYTHLRCV